ncbi:MAG: Uncharacterised protein [SAR116 cluster bacterium]|nr:MAG: Uncharacterised protein [SAR116 cluster bacterium]
MQMTRGISRVKSKRMHRRQHRHGIMRPMRVAHAKGKTHRRAAQAGIDHLAGRSRFNFQKTEIGILVAAESHNIADPGGLRPCAQIVKEGIVAVQDGQAVLVHPVKYFGLGGGNIGQRFKKTGM